MPAPNLAQLLNLPPVVERELQRRLDLALGQVITTWIPRQPGTLPEQRIQLSFTLGAALPHLRPMGDGTFQRDAWNYALTVALFTQRDKAGADLHGQLRGQLTALLQALRYDATFLPWYVLTTLVPESASESVQIGEDSDVSNLRWTGMICIRPDAWPE